MAEELLIRHSLESLGDGDISLYLTHILCLDGKAWINYNDKEFEMGRGDCAIIRATQFIEGWRASEDCRVKIVFADLQFIERARRLDFVEIADLFNFSSASYFSRYVQRYLGETPSDYRG